MTAAQLQHLAQFNTELATQLTATNPPQARILADAACTITRLAETTAHDETIGDLQAAIDDLNASVASPSAATGQEARSGR